MQRAGLRRRRGWPREGAYRPLTRGALNLATAEPARYTPNLALSLTNLGNRLSEVAEHRRALTATEEAVTLRRDLATAEPARYTPDLALSLTNLGIQLERLARPEKALEAWAEVVAWWARLAHQRPAEYREIYLRERAKLAQRFTERGFDVATAATAEQTALRGLPPFDPSVTSRGSDSKST